MREIFVYVEGPSDQLGMLKLLGRVIEGARQRGNVLGFYPLGGKDNLLKKGPLKALNILRNKPSSWVFLVPDLYPANKPFAHTDYSGLKATVEETFLSELKRKNCDQRLRQRFRVHCFKHDLEALLLASDQVLLRRLEATKFTRNWANPVENQDFNAPPKRIVEMLFLDAGKRYKDTVDAPWILERCDYQSLKNECPQNFGPFLTDLISLLE